MKFFKTLKAQHIALLITQPQKQINWRMFGVLAIVILLTGGLLYGLFGDQIITEVSKMFVDETGSPMPINIEDAKWLFVAVPLFDILGELIWMSLVAFVTMRVLKYLKTPLSFKYLFNMYLIVRVYEMLVGFALLFGFTVVSLYTGTETLPFLQEEPGALGMIMSFVIPVYFFWVYLWSVRFTTRQMTTLSKMQEESKKVTDV